MSLFLGSVLEMPRNEFRRCVKFISIRDISFTQIVDVLFVMFFIYHDR